MRLHRLLLLGVIMGGLPLPFAGQEVPAEGNTQPVMENQGQPMILPFRCSEDDMNWAGMSCSEQDPCPAYFEVAAAEPVSNKLFVAGNIHAEAVTLYSVLLASDDNGKTWREAYERIRGAGLDHIQFIEANGWVSGEALSPLPQDPFFLLSVDGGAHWQQQAISEEAEPGSIQQFFFSSKSEGSLIIDRGEGSADERFALYVSPNGGRSWDIKQASKKPLRVNRPEEENRDWRVEADRPTQSFRLEHRQGERWNRVASFAVNIGVCKPAPPSPPPAEEPRLEPAAPKPAPTPPQ
jgi:hypothetical protein